MSSEQKNLFLAIGLSMIVLFGWNYFYGAPTVEKQRQAQQATQTTAPTAAAPAANVNPGAPAATADAAQNARSRAEALPLSPRITIDTPALAGSIALKGGLIDDVSLKNFRDTIDPNSPMIELFAPVGSTHAYYAETGFRAAAGSTLALPDANTLWKANGTKLTASTPVELTWDNGKGLIFKRAISIDDRYMFSVKETVENKSGAPVTLQAFASITRIGKPTTSGYAVLHEGLLGVVGDSRVIELTYDSIEKEPQSMRLAEGTAGWMGFTDKYWATAIVPAQDAKFGGRFSAAGAANQPRIYQTFILEDARTVDAGASSEVTTTRIFAGAKEVRTIDGYQTSLGIKNFDLMIDWGWFYFITKPLFKLIDLIYHFVGNFGVAILVVTVIVKAVFFPLANRSYLSMAKMKAVQPEMTLLRERFKDDKQKQQQELMELYKREKINPVAGCLPVLVQIPVFFGLYKVIFITLEMRHAPFFGWIKDLSAPDPTTVFNLFGLLPFDPTSLPMVGHFLAIGIWPLLMGISMFVQMKMNPEPTDPVQKQMFTWMPIIFTFMLGTFPAGLVIYWTWNNLLSVTQQYFIMKRAGVKVELWDNLSGLLGKKNSA